jgi:ribosomal protein S7
MKYTNYLSVSSFPTWKKASNVSVSNYSIGFILLKFLNCIVKKGQKARALTLLQETLYFLKLYLFVLKIKKINDPVLVLYKALLNARPYVSLQNKRRGRRNVSTPCIMRSYRSLFLSCTNIIDAANSFRSVPKGKQEGKKKISSIGKLSFSRRLALELLKAYLGIGKAIEKKMDLHRKAYSQRTELRIYYRKKKKQQKFRSSSTLFSNVTKTTKTTN